MIKTVHLVFKTHLDIGFTDLASRTIDRYLNQFIPNAIKTADELRNLGGEERLVWTTGSWLVKTYLASMEKEKIQTFIRAIEMGDITWHALPFTTHTELLDNNLLSYGLSLSKELDQRFSHNTIAAKMTDVPGHTLALVPHLAKAGVFFLHIGVNGSSPLPKVPPLFVWRAPTGEEIIVQYDASYGSSETIGDLEDLLVIENSADNAGPPSTKQVLEVYERLRKRYPQARIVASSLDDYARAILSYKDRLVIVEDEIGDTWIHGIGSDPYKVSAYKCLTRLGGQWLDQGLLKTGSVAYDQFYSQLLMICEHTWGLDFKKYLADYRNWSVEDFHRARQIDIITEEAVPDSYRFIEQYARAEYEHIFPGDTNRRAKRSYSFFTSSHQEQRSYLSGALAALPGHLRKEAETALEELKVHRFVPQTNDTALSVNDPIKIGEHEITIANDGSIAHLIDASGHDLASGEGIGVYRYETFGSAEYQRFHHQYNRNFEKGKNWILADFGKPGLETVVPKVEHRLYQGNVIGLFRTEKQQEVTITALLTAQKESPRGAPRTLILRYYFNLEGKLRLLMLDWMDKEATRIPEALWLSIGVNPRTAGTWRMQKIGSLLELDRTVAYGSRSIHGVQALMYQGEQKLTISNLDSPLVSLDERKLLNFDNRLPSARGIFHFNLLNNIWNTNFPLWYEEDGRSRIAFNWEGDSQV